MELSPIPDPVADDRPATGDAPTQAYPYRAGLVLLAAVVGYPDLGPEFFTNLYRAAEAVQGSMPADPRADGTYRHLALRSS